MGKWTDAITEAAARDRDLVEYAVLGEHMPCVSFGFSANIRVYKREIHISANVHQDKSKKKR